ncbi:MAG: recombination protein NinG [Campylobacteraceae bacterium]|jgi:hypothetical protein|nr:recombination protein NinG [Campylobacteraceae bacterium]
MKLKVCKVCKVKFTPVRQFQVVCSIKCAQEYSKICQAKKQRKEKLVFRMSDKKTLMTKAQALFNRYIRLRDKNLPCISCGYKGENRQWHAGHYRPQGRNGALRFCEFNCHKQCSICNNHLSGNLVRYRENLIKKIGLETVLELENNNEVKKWTVDELKDLIQTYRQKCKEIESECKRKNT